MRVVRVSDAGVVRVMSYDIQIADKYFNQTWNLSAIFYDHIPVVDSRGGLHELDGKTGKQAAVILAEAFERISNTRLKFYQDGIRGEPEFCAKYDAPNGWGSTVGALIFLARLMAACFEHPRSKVTVS
jgi:hypothetical protein